MIRSDELPRVVFGCGNFGGLGSSPALRDKGDPREQALALLDHARGLGLTRFDTANTYGGGVSEAVLGEWLGRQDKAFRAGARIATKVGNPYGCPPGERPLSGAQVADHLDRSLRRLGLERIDLYYLHEFDPRTPLGETLQALDLALAQGKIAAFGVSNARRDDLESVLALAGGALRRAFAHVQNEFESDGTPATRATSISWSGTGLGRGSPTAAASAWPGGLLEREVPGGGVGVDPATRTPRREIWRKHRLTAFTFARGLDALRRQATERAWTVPGAALRFVLDTPGVDSLIIAPRSIEQFAAYGLGDA